MHNPIEAEHGITVTRHKSSLMDYLKKHYFLYILLAPAVILTLIFKYGPMYGAIIAFKDFSPIKGIMGSEWVGLYNFEKFLSSPNFEVIF